MEGTSGLEYPFTMLFDEATDDGPGLPSHLAAIYGGEWRLPARPDRPYTYVNFAASRDGRVSFNVPGHLGGGDVSIFNAHDRWLMALLRARADAVLVGDSTLRIEPEHVWTAAFICPPAADTFGALRQTEGRSPMPLQVFLSLTGDVPAEAHVFAQPDIRIVVATTTAGSRRMRELPPCAAQVDVLVLGEAMCDLKQLMHTLRHRYGVTSLLCEGGPRVYGSLLTAGLVDDEFLTLCPQIIGNHGPDHVRPGLVEGAAFVPATAPKPRPISLRRAEDHLFLRSRLV